ncbi:GIY-YIG nuclease family protein [Candidatus Parcubacteria bacterium]|nr:GIY-YIG nuclease family protein [Candidatus Parcubacteria bacterium]
MTSQEPSNTLKTKIKDLPDEPGVYFFIGPKKEILYIGKATSLRDRVKSYFSDDLRETRGPLIVDMVRKAVDIGYEKTDSVLESILLEASLIKKYQPPHNTDEKDDKSFNFVVITKEDFPRVLLIRERTLSVNPDYELKGTKIKYIFGPFPHGGALREALKIIRRIFPFRGDKCIPYGELKDKTKARPCFARQIGLCPGVCTGEISKDEYADQIRNIKLFFEGKKKTLVRKLEKDMNDTARAREFEKAEKIKRTLFALNHIQDMALMKRDSIKRDRDNLGQDSMRVEAYDIAHLAGTSVVGVMVVVESGEALKSDYRRFKIRRNPGVDDTGALYEILDRRLKHSEWPLPDIIAVDGGIAQKNAAESALQKNSLKIPVIGVVKDEGHRPDHLIGDEKMIDAHKSELLLANSEAHRFAINYHRIDRRASF